MRLPRTVDRNSLLLFPLDLSVVHPPASAHLLDPPLPYSSQPRIQGVEIAAEVAEEVAEEAAEEVADEAAEVESHVSSK